MLLTILIVLLVFALLGGVTTSGRYGPYSYGPGGLLVLVIILIIIFGSPF